ncbi:STAS domain-containing protein [Mycobacterium sp. 1423905.2]|uniref:STAS domain-containing protein n=1 Tax=Mycobacterium sp. 1423905.2 TaxID=1856859 RepID=UPI0007FFF629|nr:STAS domain-containing protein [Mycobacterium sp. 1423905.2]OBJ61779.1 anti-anti-sigma factor [Mycobacterium sp. 1423905.2]
MSLSLTITTAGGSACLRVAGELDYQNTTELVTAVSQLITQQPAPTQIHLDFSELVFCDSAGLSGLLLVHRQTDQAGIELHLDQRPLVLDRLLHTTGTYEHLVTSVGRETATADPQGRNDTRPGETRVR